MPHKPFHITLSIQENVENGLNAPPHGVRYHQQDKDGGEESYCGAACAQMVLASIGAGMINQKSLYDGAKDGSADKSWYTAPDGLEAVLNTRKPTLIPRFKAWKLDSEEAISRKLCWAIQKGVAPIALVKGGTHWVVVVGFTADAVPTNSIDTAYQIESFDIFNPLPVTPSDLHSHQLDGSDHCGTCYAFDHVNFRGNQYETSFTRLQEDETEGDTWGTVYMTKVVGPEPWNNHYVVICDEDPPIADAGDGASPGHGEFDEDLPSGDAGGADLPELRGARVTDLDEIRDRAARGLEASDQTQRAAWRKALAGTHVGEPLLVEREYLDPPRFYYIVPFVRDESEVPVLALVDAYESGGLISTIAAPVGSTHFGRAMKRDTVLQTFQEIDVDGATVPLAPEDLYDHLVWRPCAESLSEYWPFYRFDAHMPDGRPITIYVRIDGVPFTELHEGMGM